MEFFKKYVLALGAPRWFKVWHWFLFALALSIPTSVVFWQQRQNFAEEIKAGTVIVVSLNSNPVLFVLSSLAVLSVFLGLWLMSSLFMRVLCMGHGK